MDESTKNAYVDGAKHSEWWKSLPRRKKVSLDHNRVGTTRGNECVSDMDCTKDSACQITTEVKADLQYEIPYFDLPFIDTENPCDGYTTAFPKKHRRSPPIHTLNLGCRFRMRQ